MDGLDIEKTHLVGASAGGIVSLRFAHDFPDRLHSLTLVASTPRLAQMGVSMDAGSWRRILEEEGTRAWLMADTDKRFGPNTDRHVVEWYADEGAKTSAQAVMALQGCLLAQDLTPLLPDIAVPTLILAGNPRRHHSLGRAGNDGPANAQRRAGSLRRRRPQHEG